VRFVHLFKRSDSFLVELAVFQCDVRKIPRMVFCGRSRAEKHGYRLAQAADCGKAGRSSGSYVACNCHLEYKTLFTDATLANRGFPRLAGCSRAFGLFLSQIQIRASSSAPLGRICAFPVTSVGRIKAEIVVLPTDGTLEPQQK
jgi:hypothetical protein